MNDPDDTDPMHDETVVDTDPGPEPAEDTVSDEPEGPADQGSDDFWEWLPALGLAHRRRKELVERRSSDGAAFAAYAGAARPAVAAPALRFDAKVRIASDDEERAARDALTVVKPRRGQRSLRVPVSVAAVAAVSVSAALAVWWYPPAGRQAPVASTAAAPAPRKAVADRTPVASSLVPTEAPMPTGASSAVVATRAERPTPVSSEPARSRERSAPSRAAESPAPRGARPAPSLTKDQFFEAQ